MDRFNRFTSFCFMVFTLLPEADSLRILSWEGPCKCITTEGVIDLSPLDSATGPRYTIAPEGDDYYYSYNPCTPFTIYSCRNVLLCQGTPASAFAYPIGKAEGAVWAVDDSGYPTLTMIAEIDSVKRISVIRLICGGPSYGIFRFTGENPTDTYNFNLTTKYACPRRGMVGDQTTQDNSDKVTTNSDNDGNIVTTDNTNTEGNSGTRLLPMRTMMIVSSVLFLLST